MKRKSKSHKSQLKKRTGFGLIGFLVGLSLLTAIGVIVYVIINRGVDSGKPAPQILEKLGVQKEKETFIDLPLGFPWGFPIYPGAKIIMGIDLSKFYQYLEAGKERFPELYEGMPPDLMSELTTLEFEGGEAFYDTNAMPDEIVNYYRNNLEKEGWKIMSSIEIPYSSQASPFFDPAWKERYSDVTKVYFIGATNLSNSEIKGAAIVALDGSKTTFGIAICLRGELVPGSVVGCVPSEE